MVFEKLKYSWNRRRYNKCINACKHDCKDILEVIKTEEKSITPLIRGAMGAYAKKYFNRLINSAKKTDYISKKLGKTANLEQEVRTFREKYYTYSSNKNSILLPNVFNFIEEFEQYAQELNKR